MRPNHKTVIGALVFLVTQSAAQFRDWDLARGQNSTWICTWRQPRAALVRDTIYFDGGHLAWQAGYEDGSNDHVGIDLSIRGYILSYNLSRPFSLDTNVTEILVENRAPKDGLGGGGLDRLDGAMLANNNQFYLFGGAQTAFTIDGIADEDEVLGYLIYPQREGMSFDGPMFNTLGLPDNITDWIAYGGSTSAPSENKAWYFSGYTTPDHQPVRAFPNDSAATNVVNRLVTFDFEEEEWSTQNLTSGTDGRANPEVVWVPVGEQGILVVLGGVTYPQWVNSDLLSEDPEASREESPAFMERIDIYDIASSRWYHQRSENPPGGSFTQGCAVVATAADRTSFNIYYYGGFDGLDPRDDFYDDVWVLSLPSFEWIQLNTGSSSHARAGHRCFMPYPDQMMVFGGYTPAPGNTANCLEDGPVLNFNLTSGQWMDSYDPRNHPEYGVPRPVYDIIGGDSTGGSNTTGPSRGWESRELEEIFGNHTYNISRIWEYTPYDVDSQPGPPDSPENEPEDGGSGDNGLPSWVAPVLGVVLGLMLLAAILVIFFLWRKRKIFKNRPSDSGTNNRILPWLWAQPPPDKGMTSTASEITAARTLSPEMSEMRSVSGPTGTVTATASPDPEQYRYEVPDTQIYAELGDTSPRAELAAFARSRPLSFAESNAGAKESVVTHSTDADAGVADTATGGPAAEDADSPTIVPDPYTGDRRPRVTSGISEITTASHMRNTSDVTVSSNGNHTEVAPIAERLSSGPRPNMHIDLTENPSTSVGPVSPPTADDTVGEDYVTSRSTSVQRTSAFHEHDDTQSK